MDTVKTRSFVVAGMLESSNTRFTVWTIEAFTTLGFRFGGVAVFGAAFMGCPSGSHIITVGLMILRFNGAIWTVRLIEVKAVNTRTHGDLALDDITAVRQDGEDGGRVQNPVNHMDDPIGCHNVGGRQLNALLTQ